MKLQNRQTPAHGLIYISRRVRTRIQNRLHLRVHPSAALQMIPSPTSCQHLAPSVDLHHAAQHQAVLVGPQAAIFRWKLRRQHQPHGPGSTRSSRAAAPPGPAPSQGAHSGLRPRCAPAVPLASNSHQHRIEVRAVSPSMVTIGSPRKSLRRARSPSVQGRYRLLRHRALPPPARSLETHAAGGAHDLHIHAKPSGGPSTSITRPFAGRPGAGKSGDLHIDCQPLCSSHAVLQYLAQPAIASAPPAPPRPARGAASLPSPQPPRPPGSGSRLRPARAIRSSSGVT